MSACPKLAGEFVDLLKLEPAHAELTYGWRQSERARLLNKGADSVEGQRRWIESRPASEYNFLIALKTGKPVGMVSLTAIDKVNARAEPGRFLIGDEPSVRGVPAAVEAMLLVYELAFEQLGLNRVHGTVAADNTFMIKWQKYMGMVLEGTLRQHYFIDGRYQDAVAFGLLASEYRTTTRGRLRSLVRAARLKVESGKT